MTKPQTNWTKPTKVTTNFSSVTKNTTEFEANRALAATLIAYDNSSTAYDDSSTYYDSYNAAAGSLLEDKNNTNWSPT